MYEHRCPLPSLPLLLRYYSYCPELCHHSVLWVVSPSAGEGRFTRAYFTFFMVGRNVNPRVEETCIFIQSMSPQLEVVRVIHAEDAHEAEDEGQNSGVEVEDRREGQM